MEDRSPVGSFLKFVIGFSLFISLSIGITYAVQTYTVAQAKQQQTAAALQAMLQPEK